MQKNTFDMIGCLQIILIALQMINNSLLLSTELLEILLIKGIYLNVFDINFEIIIQAFILEKSNR